MIREIFTSIQGEGPWVGERHIFVRFSGCELRCRYCDTGDLIRRTERGDVSPGCSAQLSCDSELRETVSDRITANLLTSYCRRLITPGPSKPTISLTGGEPLLQIDFLAEWLPQVAGRFKIYLETSGIHYANMSRIGDFVDIISLDFKLPSATGLRSFWREHAAFLSAVKGMKIYVKAVVTNETTMDDVMTASIVLSDFNRSTPFVLQPAAAPLTPASSRLIAMQTAALSMLEDVRIIPQVHAVLQVP